MKIICEKCHAKYSIKDERVKGRTLKIKCKRCGGVITVSGVSLNPPAPQVKPAKSVLEQRFASSFKESSSTGKNVGTAGLYDAVKKSAESLDKTQDEAVIWFIALNDKATGPISAKMVAQYKSNGQVSDDTLVWKEGMLDWIALSSCSELLNLLHPKSKIKNIPVSAEAATANLGLFVEKPAVEHQAGPLAGMSIGSVDERTDVSKDNILPDKIDDVKKTGTESAFFNTGQLADEEHHIGHHDEPSVFNSIFPEHILKSHRRWKIMAGIGFVATSVAVLMIVMLLGNNEPTTIVKEKIVEKTQVVYRDRPIDGRVNVQQNRESSSGKGSTKLKRTRRSGVAAVKSSMDTSEMTPSERKKYLMNQFAGGGGLALRGGRGSSGSVGSSTDALSQGQMSRVVSKNRGGLQLCYERAMKSGNAPTDRDLKVLFKVSIGLSGMVKNVNLSGSGSGYASLSRCLQASVKKWMFPSSSGNSKVQFPIVFTPAR